MTETPTTPAERYALAARKAQGKEAHRAPADGQDPGPLYAWREAGCRGRLRTFYVRLTEPSADYRKPGKTRWVPWGVLCDKCSSSWRKPTEEAAA